MNNPDPTLATVDSEPWNQWPAELRRADVKQTAPILDRCVPINNALTIRERVMRGGEILQPSGALAIFVYDIVGVGNIVTQCDNCDASCRCAAWQEWQFVQVNKLRARYAARRDFSLCNTCSNKVRALPLGERWPDA